MLYGVTPCYAPSKSMAEQLRGSILLQLSPLYGVPTPTRMGGKGCAASRRRIYSALRWCGWHARDAWGVCVSELLCVLWRGVHVALCIYLLGWLDMTPLSEGSQRGGQYK